MVTARNAASASMRSSGPATRPDWVIRFTAQCIIPIGSLRPMGRSEWKDNDTPRSSTDRLRVITSARAGPNPHSAYLSANPTG